MFRVFNSFFGIASSVAFFNTGPIKGHGDPTFFIHTTLWAFLPWSLLLFAAIFQYFKQKSKQALQAEWYCICGSLLTFVVFSASKFQLPFYLNIVFPFFAILTAQYLYSVSGSRSLRAISITQKIVVILLMILIAALQYFFRPESMTILTGSVLIVLLIAMAFLPKRLTGTPWERVAMTTFLAACIVNLFLNLAFYPSLLKYQSGSEAAMWINKNNPAKLPVVQCIHTNDYGYPLEFYLDQPLFTVDQNGAGTLPQKPFLMYGYPDNIDALKARGWHIDTLKTFDRYWITRLKPKFLNAKTRPTTLEKVEVVVVNP